MRRRAAVAFVFLAAAAAPQGRAEEGLYTFDNPPTRAIEESYGFSPTKHWLDNVRLSSVRFNSGGSGAFVAKTGLVLTNHHVGLGCIQKISREEKDWVKLGYVARSPAEEVPCPDLELNVLESFEDVTKRVVSAVPAQASNADAAALLKAATAEIEKECADATGKRCDVVSLYHGSEYHLYRYKKYTDVRLVFAPEQSIAFYGGDPDNFTFPRYDLDVAVFRAYENGEPASPQRFLRLSATGVSEGELVFVSGHPGSTARLHTLAQLRSARDRSLPFWLSQIERRHAVLVRYSAASPESARRAKAAVFGVENSLKAMSGYHAGLVDPAVLKKKEKDEAELRDRVRARSAAAPHPTRERDPWETVEAAVRREDELRVREYFASFAGSKLLMIAGSLVRYVAETKKPNETRLEEYRESSLASFEHSLYSKAPTYKDLEETLLASQWAAAKRALPKDDPFLAAALAGKSPEEAAREAVAGTRLDDPEVRRALAAGGEAAVLASKDPMIVLARRIDPIARAIRKDFEENVKTPIARAGERIGRARFELFGKSLPPDATFTLRLSYGTVKGYRAAGMNVPWKTTFHGLYERSASFDDKEPYKLPPRWVEKRPALELSTPFNFVSTNDIIGGNSGSPVLNRDGEVVGVVFDGNIESLAWRYVYSDERARAISVHSSAILEALTKVFDAAPLAEELRGR